jgi:hypothetical protein
MRFFRTSLNQPFPVRKSQPLTIGTGVCSRPGATLPAGMKRFIVAAGSMSNRAPLFAIVITITITLGMVILIPSQSRAAPLLWSGPETIVSGTDELSYPLEFRACKLASEQHLVYFNETQRRLEYGHRKNESWSFESITGSIFPSSCDFSLFIWGNVPTVVYFDDSAGLLQYIRGAGAGWTPIAIPGTGDALDWKATATSDGNINVLWESEVGGIPRLSRKYSVGSSWFNETVVTLASSPGGMIAIALDASDVPHIVWHDPDLDAIRYARRQGLNDYLVETVIPLVDTCFWLDLKILEPDVPYVGVLDYPGQDDIIVRSAIRSGGHWNVDLLAPGMGWVFGSSMALATEEGESTDNRYFVYGLSEGFNCSYSQGNGWYRYAIDPLHGFPLGNVFDMDWDPVEEEVLLAFHGPSDREISFFIGQRVTTEEDLVIDLRLNQTTYAAGDAFSVDLDIVNPGLARAADLYVLLDVYNQYWFFPRWIQSLDYYCLEILALDNFTLPIIPAVILPSPLGSGGPFYFHAAAFEPGTPSVATLTSNTDSESFTFE